MSLGDKPKPRLVKRSAFSIVNAFIGMYDLAYGREKSRAKAVIPARQKLELQQELFRIKGRFECTDEDLELAFFWMYIHNPLKLEDVTEYGQSTKLWFVVPRFQRWQQANKDAIALHGAKKAIWLTAPKQDEADEFLTQLMDEYLGEAP